MDDKQDPWALYSQGVRKDVRKRIRRQPQAPALFNKRRQEFSSSFPSFARVASSWADSASAVAQPEPTNAIRFDRKVERRLRQGEVALEGKLDLHGKTQQEAFEALSRFVLAQDRLGHRCLLVVTGKGAQGSSVIRTNFPRWCALPPVAERLLALRQAAPAHGGQGAWYLLLKKRRDGA